MHLRQILMNLLSNAIKFTEQGSVELMVHRFNNAPDERAWICFKVIDTGIGLSEEAQKQIFESFVQADTIGYTQVWRYRSGNNDFQGAGYIDGGPHWP